MSAKAGKRPLRSLTAHEKLDAIRRVHDGESKASVARDIGVPESTLRGWCKNEDKISYLSRQSSPETDDSIHLEPKEKKNKIEDNGPFNLSLKVRASYSPPTADAAGFNGKAPVAATTATVEGEKDTKLSANSATQDTPKSTQMTERERNRAELARLSIELGLNRPEMFNSKSSTSNTIADLSTNIGLLAQWNTLLLQQQQQQKTSAKKNTSVEATTFPITPSSLLTYVKPDQKAKLPKVDPPKSVEDSVWYWLNQQAMLGLSQTSITSPATTTANDLPTTTQANGSSYQNSSWFWKWYKQFASTQIVHPPNKPILYQQLTKDKDVNTENLQNEEKPKSSTKARAVLDNLLLHNNNNVASLNKKECGEEDLSQTEAIEHGEKFLKWLECCGDPSVTAMQIMQLKSLLNNIKTGLDRKNNDHSKTKVKRK